MTGLFDKLRERTSRTGAFDEFDNPIEICKLSDGLIPAKSYDIGHTHELELRLKARYCVPFRSDDKVYQMMRANAEASIACLVYDDVLQELRKLMSLVGAGKRTDAFRVLNDLMRSLSR